MVVVEIVEELSVIPVVVAILGGVGINGRAGCSTSATPS